MLPRFKERLDLEIEIQRLVDGYKISTTLHNNVDFHSPASNKEMELYIDRVKYLKEASIITSQQADFLRQTWILYTEITQMTSSQLYAHRHNRKIEETASSALYSPNTCHDLKG